MKTLILTLTLLGAAALNASANTVITSSTTETGAFHEYRIEEHGYPGYDALGVFDGATYTGTNITITSSNAIGTSGAGAFIDGSSKLILTTSTISITGGNDDLGSALWLSGAATAELRDVTITITGGGVNGIRAENGANLTLDSGTIQNSGTRPGLYLLDTASATINNTTIAVADGAAIQAYAQATGTGISTLALTNSNLSGGSAALNLRNSNATVALDGNTVTGGIYADQTTLAITGGNHSQITGDLVATTSGSVTVTLDHSALTGHTVANDGAAVAITGINGSTITGDVTAAGDSRVTIAAAGSTVNGTVTASDRAAVAVTVSGTGNTYQGDIIRHDDATVAIAVTDAATGSGAFHGGNLLVGENSAWTFDQDSRLDTGENRGVWNIGDRHLTFDHLTNDGTINLTLDNDTGAGGSLNITDTADGNGTIHLTTTGDGQADPNQVLANAVKGGGANWTWDPVDWGLEELIVTPNPDGILAIQQDGVSQAGAVLNSAIAVQQSLWFAQQNSLLKRMGDLRLAPPTSPESPTSPLIDNLWLRSYGQQLNISSQVTGRAYEQLIYGVDLGTDHKFTLSADSDLYLGIYAGYGRSDIDYRTPDTDGEINSYYGGLYATWLHTSGLYLDATFKVASVNNDLKAPYGDTQLKANYSDINLGGSIEAGKKFTFKDDWFIEPQLQVNYLHILAEDYQAGPMSRKTQDLDALQLRIGSVFGRAIKLANNSILQPYVKISGVETISSGGAIRNGYQSVRANTDGARAELGGGIIWQLDAHNQLHLDYEASFGDKYDKPWGLTAGYRHQF
ncbi:MAG: autotransporter outer membrane beta-barrel domain-containing protein [Verrucomicrobiales bacterium]|nr:autotransporter outer membrane beta-barrel domain-containing protein [Verrucomicrobiales bacterium]